MAQKEKGLIWPKGFRSGGVHCGLKQRGNDLGMLISDHPASRACVFTKNEIQAAPVRYCKAILKKSRTARAVLVNSGNANACTGKKGMENARRMAILCAGGFGLRPETVLVASTGIIGHQLDMTKIEKGMHCLSKDLSSLSGRIRSFTHAVMTTDTFPKEASTRVDIGGRICTITGVTKGAGMISPNMATMLCFIATDVSITNGLLNKALKAAVEDSFNSITIDGHTSTNDTVVVLANGAAGNKTINSGDSRFVKFAKALKAVCTRLAQLIIKDGEGATKFVTINVTGAPAVGAAKSIAKAIANSPLVKTALFGADANWGRIISAAGYSGVRLLEDRLKLDVNGMRLFAEGMPVHQDSKKTRKRMSLPDITITLDLGLGKGCATAWTCDLSYKYVEINAEYHT